MEENKKTNKNLKIIIPIIAVVIIGIIVGVLFLNKEEGYRSIQVYQVTGEVILERENIGSMDAYENLNLISGDALETFLESFLRLKLDEDKYVLVEQESQIEVFATGNSEKSRTDIKLEKGAITVEVENKLGDESSFEVTTPNSVMAVRGTVFRITADVDENGVPITRITIFEGAVTVQKKSEDGTLSEETLIESGKEAIIYQEEGQEVLEILDEIDESRIPLEVLQFIKDTVIEDGREIIYSEEKVIELIDKLQNPVYTVTFMYNESVFGTQQVRNGELVNEPVLKPSPTGSWDYDFSKPIADDTIIHYVN